MNSIKQLPKNLICGEITTRNSKIYFSHYVRMDLFPITKDEKHFYYLTMGDTGEYKDLVTMYSELITLQDGDFSIDRIIKSIKTRETDYEVDVKMIIFKELPHYVSDAFNCFQYKGMNEKFNMSEVNLYTKIFKL